MKIGIGNDHAAVDMKFEVADYLKSLGYEVVNYGTDKKESCNYPEYGEAVARAVVSKEVDLGILICGTGIGISITANKFKGIRAALCQQGEGHPCGCMFRAGNGKAIQTAQQYEYPGLRGPHRRDGAGEGHRKGVAGCRV